jgi:hypothetical protein
MGWHQVAMAAFYTLPALPLPFGFVGRRRPASGPVERAPLPRQPAFLLGG